MDSDIVADLKQFISAEMHQQMSLQTTELKGEIVEVRSEVAEVRSEIHEVKDEILEAIGGTMIKHDEAIDEQVTDHETRITKLERHAA